MGCGAWQWDDSDGFTLSFNNAFNDNHIQYNFYLLYAGFFMLQPVDNANKRRQGKNTMIHLLKAKSRAELGKHKLKIEFAYRHTAISPLATGSMVAR